MITVAGRVCSWSIEVVRLLMITVAGRVCSWSIEVIRLGMITVAGGVCSWSIEVIRLGTITVAGLPLHISQLQLRKPFASAPLSGCPSSPGLLAFWSLQNLQLFLPQDIYDCRVQL